MLIIIAGMPRSASTLQSNIINEIVKIKKVGVRPAWSRDWLNNKPEVEKDIQANGYVIRKTHTVDSELISFLMEYQDKVLMFVTHRDVRDVSVSMMEKFDYSFDKSVDRISKAVESLERIQASELLCLSQDYKKLRYDLREAIVECSEFMKIDLSFSEVEEIYNILNIEKAYQASKSNSSPFWNKIKRYIQFFFTNSFKYHDENLMLHPNHVSESKGRIGEWKNKLTKAQLGILEVKFSGWFDK